MKTVIAGRIPGRADIERDEHAIETMQRMLWASACYLSPVEITAIRHAIDRLSVQHRRPATGKTYDRCEI